MKATQRLIESKISNLKIDLEAEVSTGGKVKDVFCDYSPYLEKGIELTVLAVKNPIARWILGLALLIINAVQEKNCPKEEKKE